MIKSYARITARKIKRFAGSVTLKCGDVTYITKAFIQPLRYKNKMYVDGQYLPQGYFDGGHFLYIGMPVPELRMPYEDIVIRSESSGECYTVKRAEEYILNDEKLYVWAIITPCAKLEE
ncbi:MAG: hypothetical protein ACI4I4_04450 [Acutalibacteraceae bacterium]